MCAGVGLEAGGRTGGDLIHHEDAAGADEHLGGGDAVALPAGDAAQELVADDRVAGVPEAHHLHHDVHLDGRPGDGVHEGVELRVAEAASRQLPRLEE